MNTCTPADWRVNLFSIVGGRMPDPSRKSTADSRGSRVKKKDSKAPQSRYHAAPRKAIAPNILISSSLFPPSVVPFTWAEGALADAAGAAPNLYAFLILPMSAIADNDSSSKGTEVPSTDFPRCSATESWVMSGVTETLTTNRSLVESDRPNLRKESAI